jgi:magnesium chelatase family protein
VRICRDPVRECRFTPQQVQRYTSGCPPLRDRLDLSVEVQRLPSEMLGATGDAEPSSSIRARVVAARTRQGERYKGMTERTNGALGAAALRAHCVLDRAGLRLLRTSADRLGLSARGFDRVRRVARTIADLAGSTRLPRTTWPRRCSSGLAERT